VTPRAEVLATELHNGDLVLLHLKSQAYYTLNETGQCIWQALNQGHSLAVVSQTLAMHYAITAEEAEPYVLTLISTLVAEKLVQVSG